MMMVLECGSFSSAKIYLEVRHSRAVTGRAAGADGKEVPTREVFLRPVHGTKGPALYQFFILCETPPIIFEARRARALESRSVRRQVLVRATRWGPGNATRRTRSDTRSGRG